MEGNYSQPVNLGNPEEFTIAEFAALILEIVEEMKSNSNSDDNGNSNSNSNSKKSRIVHLDGTRDDPSRRRPDISLARRELSWQPQVSVREGLRRTVEYFAQELERQGEIDPIKPAELTVAEA